MAKPGDVIFLGNSLCLVFRDTRETLRNIILTEAIEPRFGTIEGKELEDVPAIFSLKDILESDGVQEATRLSRRGGA